MDFSPPALFACRNVFFCAANAHDRLQDGLARPIDMMIVDLEDEIRAGGKAAAREAMIGTLGHVQSDRKIFVRTNSVRSDWIDDDLKAVARLRQIDGVVIPKVETQADLMSATAQLTRNGLGALPVVAVIESPLAVLNLAEIIAAQANLSGFTMGPFDLTRAIGGVREDDAGVVLSARVSALTAARARGIAAIDGPVNRALSDADKRAAFERARALGFDGKIFTRFEDGEEILKIFSPGANDVALAREIVAAFSAAGERQSISLSGGATVDRCNLVWSQRVLINSARPA